VPHTIVQGFEVLRERLEITPLQLSNVSKRHERVREVLRELLPDMVTDDFLTGSYKRRTMIAPLKDADIDIFVVLDEKYRYDYNPGSLLDKVKNTLKKAYPEETDISRDGQAVTITFRDCKVDVVPAFPRRVGLRFRRKYRGFVIANTIQESWIATDPREHITIWQEANKKHDGKLIPLIKMIKGWNKENGDLLASFHLECLILQIMNEQPIRDFPSAVSYVFKEARRKIRYSVADPAGYNYDVGTYLDTRSKKDEVKSHLETAYTRARKAEKFAAKENFEEAYSNWRLIFGRYFPAFS